MGNKAPPSRRFDDEVLAETAPQDVLCEVGGRRIHYVGGDSGTLRLDALRNAVKQQRARVAALRGDSKLNDKSSKTTSQHSSRHSTTPPPDPPPPPPPPPGNACFLALPDLTSGETITVAEHSTDTTALYVASTAPCTVSAAGALQRRGSMGPSTAVLSQHAAGGLTADRLAQVEAGVYERAGVRPLRFHADPLVLPELDLDALCDGYLVDVTDDEDEEDSDEGGGGPPTSAAAALFPYRVSALRAAAVGVVGVVVTAQMTQLTEMMRIRAENRIPLLAQQFSTAVLSVVAVCIADIGQPQPQQPTSLATLGNSMITPPPSHRGSMPASFTSAAPIEPLGLAAATPHDMHKALLSNDKEALRLACLSTERDEEHEREVIHLEETTERDDVALGAAEAYGVAVEASQLRYAAQLSSFDAEVEARLGIANEPEAKPEENPEDPPISREAALKQKKALVQKLNIWKAAYSEQHGKQPTKKHIARDATISDVYHAYMALEAAHPSKKKKKGEETVQEEAPIGVVNASQGWAGAVPKPRYNDDADSVPSPAGGTHRQNETGTPSFGTKPDDTILRDMSEDVVEGDAQSQPAPNTPRDGSEEGSNNETPSVPLVHSAGQLTTTPDPQDTPFKPPVKTFAFGDDPAPLSSPDNDAPLDPIESEQHFPQNSRKEDPVGKAARKKVLVSELNAWKAKFTEANGVAPTKADMRADPEIFPVYEEYEGLGGKKKKKDKGNEEEVPEKKKKKKKGEGGGEDAARKKQVVKELNAWKAEYEKQNGVAPTKKNMKTNPEIKQLYEEYTAILSAQKQDNIDPV